MIYEGVIIIILLIPQFVESLQQHYIPIRNWLDRQKFIRGHKW